MTIFKNFQIALELMLFERGGIFLVIFLLYVVSVVLIKRSSADK
ncbi:OadG-related small transporter subunit [Enterococcus casseliflavus]